MISSSHSLYFIRRCSAELLAFACKELFPDALFVGGDATDIGFYYDFVFKQPLHEHVLTLLDVRLKALIKEEIEIRSLEMMRENAQMMLSHRGQSVLAEQASKEEYNIIPLIQIQDFYDLAPLMPFASTGELGSIKLLHCQEITRFFDEQESLVVTRIHGTAFPDPYALKKFLKAYEQLKKKDHRLLGSELKLWSYIPAVSQIQEYWHPKGVWLKQFLLDYWTKRCRQQQAYMIQTPLIVKERASQKQIPLAQFFMEGESYVFGSSYLKSYLDYFQCGSFSKENLPIQLAEITQVYEAQNPAQIRGFYRSYSHTMDRLVTFCTEDQVIKELISSLHFFVQIVRIFSFEGQWYWVTSEGKGRNKPGFDWLAEAIQQLDFPCIKEKIQETDKTLERIERLEMRLVDSLGCQWRGPYIEVIDKPSVVFYQDGEGRKKVPVVLMASLYDSLERFIALLIEQTAGIFPLWLAPEQVRILAIGNQNHDYAQAVYESCLKQGFRVQLDICSDKLAVKIHRAEKEKVPYMLIVGDKEQQKQIVTVRAVQGKGGDKAIHLDEWFNQVREESQAPF